MMCNTASEKVGKQMLSFLLCPWLHLFNFFLSSSQFPRFLKFFCNYGRIKQNVFSSKQRLGSVGGARAHTECAFGPQGQAFSNLCISSATGLA